MPLGQMDFLQNQADFLQNQADFLQDQVDFLQNQMDFLPKPAFSILPMPVLFTPAAQAVFPRLPKTAGRRGLPDETGCRMAFLRLPAGCRGTEGARGAELAFRFAGGLCGRRAGLAVHRRESRPNDAQSAAASPFPLCRMPRPDGIHQGECSI